jgi:hypothetical protein
MPCARLAFQSLVLEAAHVLTFLDGLQSAALLPLLLLFPRLYFHVTIALPILPLLVFTYLPCPPLY